MLKPINTAKIKKLRKQKSIIPECEWESGWGWFQSWSWSDMGIWGAWNSFLCAMSDVIPLQKSTRTAKKKKRYRLQQKSQNIL